MIDEQIRTAIEIKVDRADAKRETWAKIRPWKRVTHRFLYAVPEPLSVLVVENIARRAAAYAFKQK